MNNEIYDDLDFSNKMYKLIKQKLKSMRGKLEIYFIGKLSTPTNMLIKQLTGVSFPNYNVRKINHYCTVISHWTKMNKDEGKSISLDKEYTNFNKYCKDVNMGKEKYCLVISKSNLKEIKDIKMVTIENIGSYLSDNNNQNINKFEIYLPDSDNSILNNCVIYNNPPIGYSDELDKFVVEESLKSCPLYVFVINADESILEEEMKIISMLMDKNGFIEVKFLIAYSSDISKNEYITIEQHCTSERKEIIEKYPKLIISGVSYIPNGKDSINNSSNSSDENVVPKESRTENLGEFICKMPTAEIIHATVKAVKLKQILSKNSILKDDLNKINEINEKKKRELKSSVENFESISNLISKSVKSKELKNEIFQFKKAIGSILLYEIYGSGFVIFGNSKINSFYILQAFIGHPINVNEENLIGNISIMKCNFSRTNHEYFVLQNNNKNYDISKLNDLSKLISNLGLRSDENISIELYLDNGIHPIIKDEMIIIYYNDLDIAKKELFDKYEDYVIAVTLEEESGNNKNMNIIEYFHSKHHVQFYILVSDDEWVSYKSYNTDKENLKAKYKIEIGEVINASNFKFVFYKILSNLKYHQSVNEIILLIQQFISYVDKPTDFNVNIKDISDWQFQQLDDDITMLKSIKGNSEYIRKIANKKVINFIYKILMENLNISDVKLFHEIMADLENENFFSDFPSSVSDDSTWNPFKNSFSKPKDFLKYYTSRQTILNTEIRKTYFSKAYVFFNTSNNYKEMLNDIVNNLQKKYIRANVIVLYPDPNISKSTNSLF